MRALVLPARAAMTSGTPRRCLSRAYPMAEHMASMSGFLCPMMMVCIKGQNIALKAARRKPVEHPNLGGCRRYETWGLDKWQKYASARGRACVKWGYEQYTCINHHDF